MNHRDNSLTFIVLARNHELFILDCLRSLDSYLHPSTELVFADLGSTDLTVDSARSYLKQVSRKFRVVEFSGENLTSTFGLQQLLPSITTQWVGMISGDDAITGQYVSVIEKALPKAKTNTVFNFVLQMTDLNLVPLRKATPRWSRSALLNTLWMFFENPGTSPGSIFPVQQIRNSKFMNIDPNCLIEDYPLWLCVNGSATFKKIGGGEVLYRQHAQSLSRSKVRSDYAWSIGYCIGLSKGSADNWIKGILVSLGERRWLKQINPSMHHVVLEGVACGLKFDWSINAENS
jgi:glycosyltransferase involved in cell wall biosynthesis